MTKVMRIQMIKSKAEEVSLGSSVTYVAGEFYILPEKKAMSWIEEGLAIDPDNPPVPEEAQDEEPVSQEESDT